MPIRYRFIYILWTDSNSKATWPSGYGAGFRHSKEYYLFERARVRIPQLSNIRPVFWFTIFWQAFQIGRPVVIDAGTPACHLAGNAIKIFLSSKSLQCLGRSRILLVRTPYTYNYVHFITFLSLSVQNSLYPVLRFCYRRPRSHVFSVFPRLVHCLLGDTNSKPK